MSSFMDLALKRQSCRKYEQKSVEQEKILKCLEAARIAPSGCNSQPWRYVAVTKPETVKKLAKLTQFYGANEFADQVPVFITACEENPTRLMPKIQEAYGSQIYAQGDVGISVAYLTLQAVELGLATCIMGVFDEAEVKALLGIPESEILRVIIAMGYPGDEKIRNKSRKPMEDIARFID